MAVATFKGSRPGAAPGLGFLIRASLAPAALATLCMAAMLTRQAEPLTITAAVTRPSAAPIGPLRTLQASPYGAALDEDENPDEAAQTWARRLVEAPDAAPTDAYLRFGPIRVRRDIVETVVKAAQQTQSDPSLLMAIADKESSFSTAVKASTSSATGLFQFIGSTWLKVVRKFGPDHGLEKEASVIEGPEEKPFVASDAERDRILRLRNDPYLSSLLAGEMLKHDSAEIGGRIGRSLSEGEVYLAHFLGPIDATRFMTKVVEQPGYSAAKLLPAPAKANPPIFYEREKRKRRTLTVASVHSKFEAMMGIRADRYRDVAKVVGATAYAD